MALNILKEIAGKLSGKWYTLMVDKTTDLFNTKQMVLCLHYVDDSFEVHEELIWLPCFKCTCASVFVIVQCNSKYTSPDESGDH